MSVSAGAGQGSTRDRVVFALILIVVGLAGLASQFLETTPDLGGWVVLFIGLIFIGAFTYTRQYGFLVPGGIMSGLGVGILVEQSVTLSGEASGGVIVTGLAAGFLAIWVIGSLAKAQGNHPWPLVPGVILAAVGGALLVGGQALDLLEWWGVVLVAFGLYLLWRALSSGRRAA